MEQKPEFTREQEYWICYQIGEWYLDWKNKIVAGAAFHNLGFAKEELKSRLFQKKDNPEEENA